MLLVFLAKELKFSALLYVSMLLFYFLFTPLPSTLVGEEDGGGEGKGGSGTISNGEFGPWGWLGVCMEVERHG